MRALKLSSLLFVFVLFLANAQTAQAQMNTYEVGPFVVEGYGVTPGEAASEAYGAMWDLIISIEEALPPNHIVLEFQILEQRHINTNTYVIEFVLIIWEPTPPGPPNRI